MDTLRRAHLVHAGVAGLAGAKCRLKLDTRVAVRGAAAVGRGVVGAIPRERQRAGPLRDAVRASLVIERELGASAVGEQRAGDRAVGVLDQERAGGAGVALGALRSAVALGAVRASVAVDA